MQLVRIDSTNYGVVYARADKIVAVANREADITSIAVETGTGTGLDLLVAGDVDEVVLAMERAGIVGVVRLI